MGSAVYSGLYRHAPCLTGFIVVISHFDGIIHLRPYSEIGGVPYKCHGLVQIVVRDCYVIYVERIEHGRNYIFRCIGSHLFHLHTAV